MTFHQKLADSKGPMNSMSIIFSNLGRPLFLCFLAISLIPLVVVSAISYRNTYKNLEESTGRSISSTLNFKKEQIENFLASRLTDLDLQSNSSFNIEVLKEFRQAFSLSGLPIDKFIKTDEWRWITEQTSCEGLQCFMKTYGYRDIFLLDKEGNVLFSVKDKNYLGTNIFAATISDTVFAKSCRLALETGSPTASDLTGYPLHTPDNITMFLSQTMTVDDQVIGLMALQLDLQPINKIMQGRHFMGERSHTYLVGSDLLMRSNLEMTEEPVVLKKKVRTDAALSWLQDELERHGGLENVSNTLPQITEKNRFPEDVAHIYKGLGGVEVLGVFSNLRFLEKYGTHWGIVAEIKETEAFAPATELKNIIQSLVFVINFIIILIAALLTKRIVSPVRDLSTWIRQVTDGNFSHPVIKVPNNELGLLSKNFGLLVDSLQSVTDVCKSIAHGDFSKTITVRGEHDVLGRSVNQMAANLRIVVKQANAVAAGDYSVTITPKSENDELGIALNNMISTLSQMISENEHLDWIKAGERELHNLIRGENDLEYLAGQVITFLATYLKAHVGAFFLADQKELVLINSYAYKIRNHNENLFQIGEGLVGQAALEKKSILFTNIPEGHTQMRITSGLGESSPKNIFVMPISFEDELMSVIELAKAVEFTEQEIAFLERVSESIGVSINAARSRTRMKALLGETQRQSEKLKTQQEELKVANEELEEQTKMLKVSEKKLKLQSEELQAANEELEEKTEYLERQKTELRRSKEEIVAKARELELSSKYKSEFLANLSHELRSPLNSLLILARSLADNEEGNLNEDQVESSQIIYSSGHDLLVLINDILDLSKVEAGKMDIYPEDIPIKAIVNDMYAKFSPMAKEKGLEFLVDIDSFLPRTFRSDRQKTEQILRNLLSNAFKFTEQGSVTIKVHYPEPGTRFEDSSMNDRNMIGFSIIDTGIGIPKKKQSEVFEAFQQADGSTSRRFGGTGLGLTITRKFTELLKGENHLVSAEGEGSTFTLYLPIALDDGETQLFKQVSSPPATTAPPAPPRPQSPASSNNDDRDSIHPDDKSVLIIEDDPEFARILTTLSRKRGYKCIVAGTGRNGLQLAEEFKPDGIILDIGLPDIDGLKVLESLKQNSKVRHIPVHVISASDENIAALQKGAVGFLSKPASKEAINEAFDKLAGQLSTDIKQLLVVEDDAGSQKAIFGLIKDKNINITTAGSGAKALEELTAHTFDCVILDLGLPDMTGFELIKKIAANPAITMPPVIVYTGRELTHEEHLTLSQHARSIVIKGINSSERLLDETLLFLHSVETSLPEERRGWVRSLPENQENLNGKKILLVDDDLRNTFALSKSLRKQGLEVIIADNGELTLEKLATEENIDLVIMDIMMPIMDGYETMEKIRAQDTFKDLPIIVLSAKAMPDDREKCLKAGANDFLTKPVDVDKLLSMIRVWLFKEK